MMNKCHWNNKRFDIQSVLEMLIEHRLKDISRTRKIQDLNGEMLGFFNGEQLRLKSIVV